MKEQIVSFKTAKLAKEKGFNYGEHSYGKCYLAKDCEIWQNGVPDFWKDKRKEGELFNQSPELVDNAKWRTLLLSAPTQSLLQKWLREEHNIPVWVYPYYDMDTDQIIYRWCHMEPEDYSRWNSKKYFNTYEEALEKGLQEALELL